MLRSAEFRGDEFHLNGPGLSTRPQPDRGSDDGWRRAGGAGARGRWDKGHKSEIRLLVGLCSLRSSILPPPPHRPEVLALCWPQCSSLCVITWWPSCMSVLTWRSLFPYKDTTTLMAGSLMASKKSLFTNEVTSTGTQVRTSTHGKTLDGK